jgi:hypothetical protein
MWMPTRFAGKEVGPNFTIKPVSVVELSRSQNVFLWEVKRNVRTTVNASGYIDKTPKKVCRLFDLKNYAVHEEVHEREGE